MKSKVKNEKGTWTPDKKNRKRKLNKFALIERSTLLAIRHDVI